MNKENLHTWVLVCGSSYAKIYRISQFPKLEEIDHLEHPESRLHNQDLVSSRPGRGNNSSGTRYSFAPEVDPKHHEAEKFASYLGDFLNKSEQKKDFSKLYIISTPTFLGLLRPQISHEVQKTVVVEITKDLTGASLADIESHIKDTKF